MEKTSEPKKRNLQQRVVSSSLLLLIIYVVMFCFSLFSSMIQKNSTVSQVGIDFADYYTAGHMAVHGEFDHVYDISAHRATMEQLLGIKVPFTLPWRYPSVYLFYIVVKNLP